MAYHSSENDTLDLSSQSLKTVPKSILENPNLRVLNLKNNQLTELPDFITELKYLEVLKLRNNNFKIAPEIILKFRNLKTLSLSENEITIIPESFKALSNLEDFDFGSNPLIDFPQWIDKLYRLKDLGIYDLKLEHLPDVVTRIRYLETLSLDGNNLITLPNAIGNLRYLKNIWAEGNCFESLPENFGDLRQLEKASFGVSKIKALPESISNLRQLEYLNVSENNIKKLPENIGMLSHLTWLDISFNEITTLPSSFSRLNIKDLDFLFSRNPFDDATKREIKKLFPNTDASELEFNEPEPNEPEKEFIGPKNKKTLVSKSEEKPVFATRSVSEESISKNHKRVKKQFSSPAPIIAIILFAVLIITFFVTTLSEKKPVTEITSQEAEITDQGASNEHYSAFINYRKHREKILRKNRFIYVYTNDTRHLRATVQPNIEFSISSHAPYYSKEREKTDALNALFNDKSLGYNVILNNKRARFTQSKIYDSVFNKETPKKYNLVVDYKMGKEEIEIRKKYADKGLNTNSKGSNKLHNTQRIVLTSQLLSDREINTEFKSITAPILNLDAKDYRFYFSPHDNNYSDKAFNDAILDLEAMFLKINNKHSLGKIYRLTLSR